MTENTPVQDAEIVPAVTTVVPNPQLDIINAQEADFQGQLVARKNEMAKLQKQFEETKNIAIKLEGALESLAILKKSLTAPTSK